MHFDGNRLWDTHGAVTTLMTSLWPIHLKYPWFVREQTPQQLLTHSPLLRQLSRSVVLFESQSCVRQIHKD
jgi:hypothetical protein